MYIIQEKNKNISNKNERRCTTFCILLYSGVSTYVGLHGSGLFNFGSHLTLFACLLGFDIPHLLSFLLEMFFYYSCFLCCFFFLNGVNIIFFVH